MSVSRSRIFVGLFAALLLFSQWALVSHAAEHSQDFLADGDHQHQNCSICFADGSSIDASPELPRSIQLVDDTFLFITSSPVFRTAALSCIRAPPVV